VGSAWPLRSLDSSTRKRNFATPSFAFDEPALLVGSREDGFEDDVV
jgi:hypothetical protein